MTVLTERGLQQFILEDAENLQFADASLRDKIGQALLAIQGNRAKEARTLELSARGQGKRTIRVAYIVDGAGVEGVVSADLLGDATAPRSALQGWATVENLERPGLEGGRADARLRPARRFPSGAVRSLLRDAPGRCRSKWPAG